MLMYRLALVGAIALEIAGTVARNPSHGFTRTLPSALLIVFRGLSLALMTVAVKRIDLSVACAIWSGVGTALIGGGVFRGSLPSVQVVRTVASGIGLRAGAANA